jgi:MFS family permease
MKYVSIKDRVVMNAYWLGSSFMWNSLHVIILPAVLLNFVPEALKNTYLGLLTFAGLIVAMIIQPLSGAASDHVVSRWGKRRPFILIGVFGDIGFLIFLSWAGGILWLAVGYLGLQFSSNVAQGPAQGIIPDQVPSEHLGTASGTKNMMDIVGLIMASAIMGRIYLEGTSQPFGPIAVVACFIVFWAGVTIIGIHEKNILAPALDAESKSHLLHIDFKHHTQFWWLILSRFIFLLGIYDIQAFLQYYLRDVLAVSNPIQLTGDLMAVVAVMLAIFSLAGGKLGDRYGHKKVQLCASFLSSAACVLMLTANNSQRVLIFGSFLGMGIGLFMTSNWALANRLAPKEEAGKYLGLTNLATAGAGAVARLGGPLIDTLNHLQPGVFAGYTTLFGLGAILTLTSAWFLKKFD